MRRAGRPDGMRRWLRVQLVRLADGYHAHLCPTCRTGKRIKDPDEFDRWVDCLAVSQALTAMLTYLPVPG
jgi:hypothetical protein